MIRATKLTLYNENSTRRVEPGSALDYGTFSDTFGDPTSDKELEVFEKYIASRILLGKGFETYLDPVLKRDDDESTIQADVCGIKKDELVVAFCSAGLPEDSVWKNVRLISQSQNAQSLILSPEEIAPDLIEEEAPRALDMGKIQIETLGWFEDTLERTLQQTLRTIELLVNETRMRMLAPLLQKSALKRDFRARINPKLVYHNLTALSEAGIVDEPVEGTFELSQLGKTVLPEFIAFLEKTRKTLDDYRSKEVKSIGRR
jgi:DNA-binding transcriptional ArsR family regulator